MLFNALDDMCRKFELTKIETIGDAYWCSHGLSTRATPADARKMLLFAAALRKVAGTIKIAGEGLQVRIGIHVGPMLGGIVGNRFPRYHLFGPHAKVGQLLEQAGNAEATLVSDTFRQLLMQRETSRDPSPAAAVSAAGRKYLQRGGSSSGSESGGRQSLPRTASPSSSEFILPSESWNVIAWQASSEDMSHNLSSTQQNGRDLPAELGPVILELDSRHRAKQGAVLRRHEGLAQSALSSLDSTIAEMVLPAWFAFDIVTPEVSSQALHDAKALAGEEGEGGAVLANFQDTTIEVDEGWYSAGQGAELGRSTCMPSVCLSHRTGKVSSKVGPESSTLSDE